MTKKEKVEFKVLTGVISGGKKSLFSVKKVCFGISGEVTECTFSTATGCENNVRPKNTRPAAAHRVHGLDHARSRGHAAGVLLQTVRLLVYCFHLDVRLTQSDPASTWKQNTGRLRVAAACSVFLNQWGAFIRVAESLRMNPLK